jgi:hypothetical protein
MMKSLFTALIAASLAAVGLVGVAQAHHKVGHCVPGIFSVGCPITPQQPVQPGK